MPAALDTATKLHSAAIRLIRAVRAADNQTGLSAPKLSALSVLVFGGPQSLKSLAQAEQVTAPTMSKLVADLEVEGLVAKRPDTTDRRGLRIESTAKGRALMERGRKARLSLLTKRLVKLSAADRAKLEAAAGLMQLLAIDER